MPTARDLAVKYTSRPSCCRACGEPAWWNGTRVVAPVRRSPEGRVEHEPETVRHRARCSSKSCPLGSWTVYEQNDYPHRVFQLDVVVAAVSMFVYGAATMTAAAKAHLCYRDSVRRWRQWIASLAAPRDLERLCSRIDSAGLPPPVAPESGDRAARVLVLLDHLARLMATRGVELPRCGAGPVRLLVDRLVRFGEVFYLTKSSPPLRADIASLAL